jgi:thioredoxin-like negative regulator of GroEL
MQISHLRAFSLRAFLVVVAAGCAGVPGLGEEPGHLQVGTIIDPVVCRGDATQTHALYLPTTLDASVPAPVIFCFEPGARGRLPVERFQAGAEKFGYIVAGSNNSRNGPFEPQRIAVNAMFSDVFARFAVDQERIVLTGMSGGARLAIAVAQQTGLAHAVIACGAGFPRGQQPGATDFLFIGVAGVDDFNFPELRRTHAALTDAEATHRFFSFPGGHEWPPPEVATRTLEWLELQTIRSGEHERNDVYLDDLLTRTMAMAETLAPADRLLEWGSIVADFDGLVDVALVRARLDDVVRSPEGRALVRVERDEQSRQEAAMIELNEFAREGKHSAVRKLAANWRHAAEASADSSQRRIARRVVGDAATYGREGGQEAMTRELYADAVNLFELCAAFRPERPAVFVDLARAYAGGGNPRRALTALQQAIDKGYSDASRIENAAEFRALRGDKTFQAIVAAARKNSGGS